MRLNVLSSLLALGIATAAVAQDKPPAPPAFTFTFKGFVGASVFVQDAPMALTQPAATGQTGQFPVLAARDTWPADKLTFGGDVRQTRMLFAVKGPSIMDTWTPNGVIELDWSGGVGGAPFGDENIVPRIRQAFVELTGGAHTLRVGQANNIIIGFIPASAAHIAFPFSYAAGMVGWRSPGITYLYKTTTDGGLNVEVGLQINRNSWVDLTPAATSPSLGEASGLPQVQARVMLTSGKNVSPFPLYPVADWLAYLAAHYDQKDLSGPGATTPVGSKDKLTTYAIQGGFKSNQIPNLTIALNGWYGQNAGNIFGHMIQMGPTAPSAVGAPLASVSGYGAWGQLGYAIGGPWSLWGFMGFDNPDWEDAAWAFGGTTAANAARVRNVNSAASLLWRDGPVVIGLEWFHSFTTYGYGAPVAGAAPTRVTTYTRNANQYMLTADYFF